MFIISAFSMIMLHLLVWMITLIIKFMSRKKPIGSLIKKIEKVVVFGLPQLTFILTSAEFTLLLFYQTLFFSIKSQLSWFSFFMGILSFLYFLFNIIWILFATNRNYEFRGDKDANIFLFYFVKEDRLISRNYFSVLVLRKVISSLVLVYGYDDATLQIVFLTIFYFFYFIYILLVRPFKQRHYNIFACISDGIIFLIHLLFLFMVCQSNPD